MKTRGVKVQIYLSSPSAPNRSTARGGRFSPKKPTQQPLERYSLASRGSVAALQHPPTGNRAAIRRSSNPQRSYNADYVIPASNALQKYDRNKDVPF